MNRLTRTVALISGAARGLGAELARELAAEGASVVIADVLEEDGRRLADEIGSSARFVPLDVRSYEQWNAAVTVAQKEFGRLDVLTNNAGVVKNAPIDQHTPKDWTWPSTSTSPGPSAEFGQPRQP